jgi:aryl-alcohol dehydrogenase-like predicted oxidoreductase
LIPAVDPWLITIFVSLRVTSRIMRRLLMEYRTLGRSDLRVSAIGLGGATFGREIDEPAAFDVLDRAFERGVTLFDTAEAYSAGRSEEILGRWIASRGVRDRIVLATKVAPPLAPDRVLASAEASLRRLGVEAIDLFQLHSWDQHAPLEETLAALDELVRAGKVRYAGCSNFTAEHVGAALALGGARGRPRMQSVQPVYNLALREIERELLPLCRAEGVGVMTYSPLGAGFLTGKYRQGGSVPGGTRFEIVPGHQQIYFNDACFAVMERLRAAADELEVPMARLGLAWVLSRPGITATLVGARGPAQVDQAFDAAELARSPDARAVLDDL